MNRDDDRARQQDARAWSARTGLKYVAARRLVDDPFAQGILGPRVSARQLLATLDQHPILRDGALTEFGIRSTHPLELGSDSMLRDVALSVDFLRLFGPARREDELVGSYTLKHTAERFLRPALSYLSNGRLIWAAAHLNLPVRHEPGSPNVAVAISALEHGYVRRSLDRETTPRAHHNRPDGFEHLRSALDLPRGAAPQRWGGDSLDVTRTSDFHEWLLSQIPTGRGPSLPIEHLAVDYRYGIEHDDDPIALDGRSFVEWLERGGFHDAATVAGEADQAWRQERRQDL